MQRHIFICSTLFCIIMFCLHKIKYEPEYYKACMGGTCNRRIDMKIAMLTRLGTSFIDRL